MCFEMVVVRGQGRKLVDSSLNTPRPNIYIIKYHDTLNKRRIRTVSLLEIPKSCSESATIFIHSLLACSSQRVVTDILIGIGNFIHEIVQHAMFIFHSQMLLGRFLKLTTVFSNKSTTELLSSARGHPPPNEAVRFVLLLVAK